jgi:hypothetical protein
VACANKYIFTYSMGLFGFVSIISYFVYGVKPYIMPTILKKLEKVYLIGLPLFAQFIIMLFGFWVCLEM